MRWSRALAFIALLSMTAWSPLASAQKTNAADAQTALELYKAGKARREHGDLPAALEKLRAAYALVETPITALELGRTYAMMGKIVEARETLLGVARLPVRKNESKKATEARAESEKLATELKPRLATITVRVKGDAKQTPKLSVDGVVVPPEAASVPRVVNPGTHLVVLEIDGRTTQAETTVREGESSEVAIDAPEAPPPDEAPPGSDRAEGSEPSRRSPLVYAGFGTAVVALAVGTVTGILTLSKASALDGTCRGARCPPSAASDLDSASMVGTISTVAFAVTGAGVAVGAAGLFLSKGEPAAGPSARVFVVPGGAGVRGTF